MKRTKNTLPARLFELTAPLTAEEQADTDKAALPELSACPQGLETLKTAKYQGEKIELNATLLKAPRASRAMLPPARLTATNGVDHRRLHIAAASHTDLQLLSRSHL